ncbi:unnamed protein product [Linum trigynum]|uniref:Uncharacterized protein n=1 Tax=Linum trigynum TaxID=586398 RepID=A0AAV2F4J2_9ROSI
MERGALSSLLKAWWSTIQWLLRTAGRTIAWSLALSLEVALANQGFQDLFYSVRLHGVQYGDQGPCATSKEKCNLHPRRNKIVLPIPSKLPSFKATKGEPGPGHLKRKRRPAMDPVQTGPQEKRSRYCKR